jgi:purine nucleosidase
MKEVRGLLVLLCALASMVAGSQTAPQTAAEPQFVILDTDIGDGADDAFALALALQSPELRILGITTTYGDTELRARLVDRYLAAIGRTDIPVAAGVATPHDNVFTEAAYAMREPDHKHPDAVQFLFDQIRKHPGQITLIGIGPLSNVEAAIKRDPVSFRKLKRVVIMGGSIYRGYDNNDGSVNNQPCAEWNIVRDPAGAKALLNSGVPVFMMPLDSTQINLQTGDQIALYAYGSSLTDQLTLLYHQWTAGGDGHWGTPTLYDPVAVMYAFRPDVCPAKPMHIEADDKGFTRPVQGTPNASVCLQSNEASFLQLFRERLKAEVVKPIK